jgi:hypothetical protein
MTRRKIRHKKRGPKIKIQGEILNKLEHCFALGTPDKDACLFAGISEATLYNFQNENPKFLERKHALKEITSISARMNIKEAIVQKKDLDMSKWYLERKKKDEFGSRTELTGAGGTPLNTTIDATKLSDAAMEEILNAKLSTSDE